LAAQTAPDGAGGSGLLFEPHKNQPYDAVRAVVHVLIHRATGRTAPAGEAGARPDADVFSYLLEESRIAVIETERF